MLRKVPLIEGEHFHIYNRGVDKRIIFTDVHDYHRFIMLLYLCNSSKPVDIQALFREGLSFTELFSVHRDSLLVDIGAWVLMPNHFHLVLKSRVENGIPIFMKKVCTGYSSYFNKKHPRSGALFQGPYKAEHASDDSYLKYLFSYLHLNPLKLIPGEAMWKENGLKNKNNAINFINRYEYSSFPDYIEVGRKYECIINKKLFADVSIDFNEMIESMFDWLDSKDD